MGRQGRTNLETHPINSEYCNSTGDPVCLAPVLLDEKVGNNRIEEILVILVSNSSPESTLSLFFVCKQAFGSDASANVALQTSNELAPLWEPDKTKVLPLP